MMIGASGPYGSEIGLAHMGMGRIGSRFYQDIRLLIFEKHGTGIDLKSYAGNANLLHQIDRLGCGRNEPARITA